jgi:unsaturated rhamnogalacturonyl hydrolase
MRAPQLAEAIMARWPYPSSINEQGWEYNTGIVLYGLSVLYQRNGDARYLDYIRRWVDRYVDPEGHIDLGDVHNLDKIQPGMLLLFLYEETGDERYHAAAQEVVQWLSEFPRNAEGGFWHKDIYPQEMWVDGIYMAQPFLVRYAHLFGDDDCGASLSGAPKFPDADSASRRGPEARGTGAPGAKGSCIDTALFQTTLLAQHAQDPATGLLRHGWDQDRNAAWADPATGLSPEAWSRGMGWYTMALVEMLQDLPPEHPGTRSLRAILQDAAGGLEQTQDPQTGLWYQVMDKGDRPDNWLETSGSAMFVYALATAVDRGYLDASYREVAEKGWVGLQTRIMFDANHMPEVTEAVEGMGVQRDYVAYVARRRLANSTHGLMAVLLASSVMERWAEARGP